jgi:Uncharacterized conserved protein
MRGLFLLLLFILIPAAPEAPQRNPKDKLMYVWVPPELFDGLLGGDKECYEDEKPAHTVQLTNGFWMGQTEVTVPAFMAFTHTAPIATPSGQKGSNYPVTGVIWSEADAYCKWAGGRPAVRSGMGVCARRNFRHSLRRPGFHCVDEREQRQHRA